MIRLSDKGETPEAPTTTAHPSDAAAFQPAAGAEIKLLVDGRVLNDRPVTGVQRYVIELIEFFRREGVSFDVARPRGRARWSQHLWEHFVLPRQARRYDVLFCPANVAPLHVPSGTRLVVTLHSVSYLRMPASYRWSFRTYYRLLIPWVIRKADAIITVSASQGREIVETYPRGVGKVFAIPLGANEEFRPPTGSERRPAILFVGDDSAGKNLRGLLEAFAAIAHRFPHELWIIGESSQALKRDGKFAAALGKLGRGRVRWFGQVNCCGKLAELYREAKVLVLPSLYESFGLPALEAMACGTPVIVSDIPALREVVGEAGVFVAPGDVKSLAAAIERVLDDGVWWQQLSSMAVQRAANYSWQSCARKTLEVFRLITGKGSRREPVK